MKDGEQSALGKSVDAKLAAVKQYLPDDLIIAPPLTSRCK
jgi:hypothetical protein